MCASRCWTSRYEIIVGEGGGIRKFCWHLSSKIASMELVDTGENLSGLSVQTLGQTPIKTANKSCKHRSDSCVFDWFISVSAIHAPSVPLRSSQLACSVPSEHPVTDTAERSQAKLSHAT